MPHSLELGVLVVKQSEPVAERLVRIKVSDGMIVQEAAENLKTTYLLKNKLDEPFTFVLEHYQVLANSEMKTGGLGGHPSREDPAASGSSSTSPPRPGHDRRESPGKRLPSQSMTLTEHTW